MKKITNIKQIGSNKYSLTIDNKKHVVYDDVLLKYNILKACEISDDIYKEICKTNNYYEGYNKCLKYILAKQRTENEIREKLKKLLVSKDDAEQIIERLYEEHYLDDDKYIQSYINDEVLLKLNGPRKIFFELSKKGFKDEQINKYLSDVDNNIWEEKAPKIYNKMLKKTHNVSKKIFEIKLKKEFDVLGYGEIYYASLFQNVDYDEKESYEKEYNKLLKKYQNKYPDDKLEIIIKQKLYQKGYRIKS